MATQDIARQLVEAVQNNPQLISQLTSNPANAVKGVTGLDLSSQEITEVVACATKLAKGEDVDMEAVAGIAADLFSKHGGDLSNIMGSLLGAENSSDQQSENAQAASTTAGDGKEKTSDSRLAATASDSNSEGIDLSEVANIAESLFGGK